MQDKSPYFELAGRFWAEDERAHLSPWATRLYFRLLHEANRRFWQGPLYLSWTYLLGVLGLKSRDTLSRAISDLKSRGLILYKREGKQAVFWFPGFDQSSIRTDDQSSIRTVKQDFTNSVLYTDRSDSDQSSIRTVTENFTKSVRIEDSTPDQKTDRSTDRFSDYKNKTIRQEDYKTKR